MLQTRGAVKVYFPTKKLPFIYRRPRGKFLNNSITSFSDLIGFTTELFLKCEQTLKFDECKWATHKYVRFSPDVCQCTSKPSENRFLKTLNCSGSFGEDPDLHMSAFCGFDCINLAGMTDNWVFEMGIHTAVSQAYHDRKAEQRRISRVEIHMLWVSIGLSVTLIRLGRFPVHVPFIFGSWQCHVQNSKEYYLYNSTHPEVGSSPDHPRLIKVRSRQDDLDRLSWFWMTAVRATGYQRFS